jgi:hypothetical protein
LWVTGTVKGRWPESKGLVPGVAAKRSFSVNDISDYSEIISERGPLSLRESFPQRSDSCGSALTGWPHANSINTSERDQRIGKPQGSVPGQDGVH